MNIDCIFNVLQFSSTTTITNTLQTNKATNSLNTQHLWKLLDERNFVVVNENDYYQAYKSYYEHLKVPYTYGKRYQIVVDYLMSNLKMIPPKYFDIRTDEYDIIGYMNSKKKSQIIEESQGIIYNKYKNDIYNNSIILYPAKYNSNFYLGRCVQFITHINDEIITMKLDATKSYIGRDEDMIIKAAHYMYSVKLMERELDNTISGYKCLFCNTSINTDTVLNNLDINKPFSFHSNYWNNHLSADCHCGKRKYDMRFTVVPHLDACSVHLTHIAYIDVH